MLGSTRGAGKALRLVALAVGLAALSGPGAGASSRAREGAVEKPVEARLQTLDGKRMRLSELRGRPVLVDFWATWCLPCREQARMLGELRAELERRGVRVLAVNMGEEPELVRGFLDKSPSELPVLLDRYQVLARRVGVGTVPAIAILRADGTVAAVREGGSSREDVLSLLASLG